MPDVSVLGKTDEPSEGTFYTTKGVSQAERIGERIGGNRREEVANPSRASSLQRRGRLEGEGDSHQARRAGLGSENLQPATMIFDDSAAHG
jgi:hypothetical protein